MQALLWSALVKRKLNHTAALSNHIPSLSCCQKMRNMTGATKSQIQAAEIVDQCRKVLPTVVLKGEELHHLGGC